MVRILSTLLTLAVLLTAAGQSQAQFAPAPGSPPPPPPPPGGPAPVLPAPVAVPGSGPANPVPFPSVPPPTGPFGSGGPGYAPEGQPTPAANESGWFAAFELGLIHPQLHGNLTGPVVLGGVPVQASLPFADLEWTGSPRIKLGYRFCDNGSFVASYRSVVSEGTGTIPNFDPLGSGFLKTRLNMNVVDLDYVSPDFNPAPFWDLQWTLGARIAAAYFDSRATGMVIQESTTNNFVGGGPHVGLDVRRHLDLAPGLALFGSLDGAVVIGGISQSFAANVAGSTRSNEGQSVPVLGFRAGLSYAPPNNPDWFRFTFGYEVDQWWGLGDSRDSHADLTVQGLFLRGEFKY